MNTKLDLYPLKQVEQKLVNIISGKGNCLTFNWPMIDWGLCDNSYNLRGNPLPENNLNITRNESYINTIKIPKERNKLILNNKKEFMGIFITCSGIWCDFIFCFASILKICKWSWVVPGTWASRGERRQNCFIRKRILTKSKVEELSHQFIISSLSLIRRIWMKENKIPSNSMIRNWIKKFFEENNNKNPLTL